MRHERSKSSSIAENNSAIIVKAINNQIVYDTLPPATVIIGDAGFTSCLSACIDALIIIIIITIIIHIYT